MSNIDRALNELYVAAEDTEGREERLETAIEILQDALMEIECQMACQELCELIQNISSGYDLEPIIYELEVMNNEL